MSSQIILKAIGLPSTPLNLRYDNTLISQQNAFNLLWDMPLDTGLGDQTFPIQFYSLEYSILYNVTTNPNANFSEISQSTILSFVHENANLIYGNTYSYRVRAKTTRGFSNYSNILTATLMKIPDAPIDIPISTQNTNKIQIEITYTGIVNNGGSAITNYNLYIDDGNNGSFGIAINNNLNKSYIFTGLSTGKLYRIKYSAVNSIGESNTSNYVSIYSASKPTSPQNLQKVLSSIVEFGVINISWQNPIDNGGLDITKYNIYLNDVLFTSVFNTETSYKYTQISSGIDYKISIACQNLIGESPLISINANSSILPGEILKINLISSTLNSLKISFDFPIYDGGLPIISYDVRRNEGLGTSFISEVNVTGNTYEFTNIIANASAINKMLYGIQVRAKNSNGYGNWSQTFSFYVVDIPSAPQNFRISSQAVNNIKLQW